MKVESRTAKPMRSACQPDMHIEVPRNKCIRTHLVSSCVSMGVCIHACFQMLCSGSVSIKSNAKHDAVKARIPHACTSTFQHQVYRCQDSRNWLNNSVIMKAQVHTHMHGLGRLAKILKYRSDKPSMLRPRNSQALTLHSSRAVHDCSWGRMPLELTSLERSSHRQCRQSPKSPEDMQVMTSGRASRRSMLFAWQPHMDMHYMHPQLG